MPDLSCKNITVLQSDHFSKKDVTNFTSVHLNDSCIGYLQPNVFETLVALRHLYLQNNQISEIHFTTFQSNIHLITLDLSGNKLQELHRLIFNKNSNLLWVNITGNPLKTSAVQPTLFDLSLNIIETDTCNNTENSIHYFQAIPYLRRLNLEENAVFTVRNLRPYENIGDEEMSLENYVIHKFLNSDYSDSTELRYDGIQKVILGPSNASVMCFCNRLSAWFLCFEQPLLCPGHISDTYSLLNCNVMPTGTSPFHTPSSSSAPVVSTAPALSTTPSAEVATTDDTKNFTTNTTTSNKYPEQKTAGDNVIVYATIGVVSLVIIIVIVVVWIIVVRWRRKKNFKEQRVQYNKVPLQILGPYSSTSDHKSFDRRYSDPESPIYAEPVRNKLTTFHPPGTSTARVDSVRRVQAGNF
jgi:hypothetical protein